MKILVAVMSCARDQDLHRAIRETWGGESVLPLRFFMGGNAEPRSEDEVLVKVPDDYHHVTEKSRAMFAWALENDFDFILHCGRDTYVSTERLASAGLESFDYAGCRTGGGDEAVICPIEPNSRGWCEYTSGGAGTWLSRKAMQLIIDSPLYHTADDLLYGMILGKQGIPLYHHPGFQKRAQFLGPSHITAHLSIGTGMYHPLWMYKAHRRTKACT